MTHILADWARLNSPRLKKVAGARRDRGQDVGTPLALDGYASDTSPPDSFLRFAEEIGRRDADAFYRRLCEHAAIHGAWTGALRTTRDQLGPFVLSRPGDPVSKARGRQVWDALIVSGVLIRDPNDVATCGTTSDTTSSAPGDALCPVLSCPDLTLPPNPQGDPSHRKPLQKHERAVFEAIYVALGRADPAYSSGNAKLARALRQSLITDTPRYSEIRTLIEQLTARFQKDVADALRILAMQAKQAKAEATINGVGRGA